MGSSFFLFKIFLDPFPFCCGYCCSMTRAFQTGNMLTSPDLKGSLNLSDKAQDRWLSSAACESAPQLTTLLRPLERMKTSHLSPKPGIIHLCFWALAVVEKKHAGPLPGVRVPPEPASALPWPPPPLPAPQPPPHPPPLLTFPRFPQH